MTDEAKGSKKWQWILVAIAAVIMFVFLIMGGNAARKGNKEVKTTEPSSESVSGVTQTPANPNSEDSILMKQQSRLVEKYGPAPAGFIWYNDGSLLSLGDKSMAAEDVVYAYLNGIRQLDFATAQRFSRDSIVYSSFNSFYNSRDAKHKSYSEDFKANLYRLALLSIKVQGIESNTVFAGNKQVFTITINVLDLSDKDFWLNEKLDIYKNLYLFDKAEDDGTKADQYLYDYLLNYYRSGNAKTHDITINLTVEKYPDLDTGWLVSTDKDIDSACRYTDGKLVITYIKEMYRGEWRDYEWYFNSSQDPQATDNTNEVSSGDTSIESSSYPNEETSQGEPVYEGEASKDSDKAGYEMGQVTPEAVDVP